MSTEYTIHLLYKEFGKAKHKSKELAAFQQNNRLNDRCLFLSIFLFVYVMDSEKESDFLSRECKRLTEKIKVAHTKGNMGHVFKRGEEIKAEKALEEKG
jgi:hypothetical protein